MGNGTSNRTDNAGQSSPADKVGQVGKTVYVVDGSRTPQLKAKGKPGPFQAADLAVGAGRPLLARQFFHPSDFDEVILGCVMPGPDEVNIARVVALRLGCGKRVPAWTVQRNCASGMQALDCAARNIASGRAHLILAGGVEAMSHAPVLLNNDMVGWLSDWSAAHNFGTRLAVLGKLRVGHLKPIIGLLRGLTDPIAGLSMGQTAENLAHRFNISRERMDTFALESHRRLAKAQDDKLLGEIETLYDTKGNAYEHDDGLRRGGDRENDMVKMAKLKPVFDREFGNVTAGNSAQITDGAALLILASAEAVEKYKLPVLGRILDTQWAGVEPAQMGLGPAHSIVPLMRRHNFNIQDIDYWEINEAFAAQVLACLEAWKDSDYCRTELGLEHAFGEVDLARLNIDGGGVSLGHPVGASGARIVLHLLNVLKRTGTRRGVASLCIGGGQGGAMLVESGRE